MEAMASLPPSERPLRESRRARQQALIAGIAAGRSVIEAAAEAGIGWRRAYVWRAEDAQFRAAWDKARAQLKARVRAPAEPLAVPPRPSEPAPPAFSVPPSPSLPPLPPPPPPIRITVRRFDFEDEMDEGGTAEELPERTPDPRVADQS